MTSKRAKRPKTAPPPSSTQTAPPPSTPDVFTSRPIWLHLRWFLPALLLAAGIVRIIALGRAGLWQDEMLMVMTAQPGQSLSEVWISYWERLIVSLAWLPLPALILNAFMSAMSSWVDQITHDPFWTRLPGALAGSAGVWGMVLLVRRRLPEWIAFAAILLYAFTFYPVFYAREIHAYPYLLALTPFALHYFLRGLFDTSAQTRDYLALAILSLLLAYTHLTAPMLVFAMTATAGGIWLYRLKFNTAAPGAPYAFRTALALGFASLSILPVFLKILTQESPHLAQASGLSILFMINDVVVKLMLGDHFLPTLAAWLLFGTGVVALIRDASTFKPFIRTLLSVYLLAFLLILAAAARSQYLSARYFAVIAPFFFIIYGAGLQTAGRVLAQLFLGSTIKQRLVANLLLFAILAIHLFVFLPPMYQLMNKSVDFGSIAGWLNDNLPPGTPYVMESPYELRYVSQYYPTPDLIPAVPYVHGSDPADFLRLLERQRDFLLRFPEAVFVQSVHQNYGTPQGVWTFPDEYFRHHVELRDNSLRSLVLMGIYPTHFRSDFHDRTFTTRIHFNLPDDLRHYARLRGEQVRILFPGWQIAQIAQFTYARAFPGYQAPITVENLTEQTIHGRFVLEGLIQTPSPGIGIQTQLRWGNTRFGPYAGSGNNPQRIESEPLEVAPGEHLLYWNVVPAQRTIAQALFILNAYFIPDDPGDVISPPPP